MNGSTAESRKIMCACVLAIAALMCLSLVFPSDGQAFTMDDNGEMSGLFASMIGVDAIYPITEYFFSLSGSDQTGHAGTYTDLLGIYHNVVYRNFSTLTPEELDELAAISGLEAIHGLELLIVGEFPSSRAFNFTSYDNHSVVTDQLADIDAVAISDSYVNPYSTIYTENRFDFDVTQPNYYAFKIKIGDDLVDEAAVDPSCSLANYSGVSANVFDGTLRHGIEDKWCIVTQQGEWKWEFKVGHDPGPNLGGHFAARRYGDRTPEDPFTHFYQPFLLLRETSTGCPIPFRYLEGEEYIDYDPPRGVVSNMGHTELVPGSVQPGHVEAHLADANYWHGYYHSIIPYGGEYAVPILDPVNQHCFWTGKKRYAAAINPFAEYLMAYFLYDWIPKLNPGFSYPVDDDPLLLVIHFKLPSEPGFPCDDPGPDGCPGAAGTELRYLSLTFNGDQAEAVHSINRNTLEVIDEETQVGTLVVSFLDTGEEPHERPPGLDPRFNWLHLPSEYHGEDPDAPFSIVTMLFRMQVGDEVGCFTCSPGNVFEGFGEHTPAGVIGDYLSGGFMGDYVPQVDVTPLSMLLDYQEFFVFHPDPVGGECTTDYTPYLDLDNWHKIISFPYYFPE